MILYKEWLVEKPKDIPEWNKNPYKMSGWFLFGIIPLYVRRIGV